MDTREKIVMLEEECMSWRLVHARVESRLMDAENLLAEAADFVGKIKVGVSTKRRDSMEAKLRAFAVPDVIQGP